LSPGLANPHGATRSGLLFRQLVPQTADTVTGGAVTIPRGALTARFLPVIIGSANFS